MGMFKIDADEFYWLADEEEGRRDYCLHGRVTVQVGNRTFEDGGTVSSTALYLLKSLESDHIMGEDHNQMIPCCGHFMIANEDLSEVAITGCAYGTDWSVLHSDGKIKIVLETGEEETIDFDDYKAEVFRFADKVEAFYQSCPPKILPEDEFRKNGYLAMWNEWHRRRNA